MKSVREIQIKLANGYIERAIKHTILSDRLYQSLYIRNDSARSSLAKTLLIN